MAVCEREGQGKRSQSRADDDDVATINRTLPQTSSRTCRLTDSMSDGDIIALVVQTSRAQYESPFSSESAAADEGLNR